MMSRPPQCHGRCVAALCAVFQMVALCVARHHQNGGAPCQRLWCPPKPHLMRVPALAHLATLFLAWLGGRANGSGPSTHLQAVQFWSGMFLCVALCVFSTWLDDSLAAAEIVCAAPSTWLAGFHYDRRADLGTLCMTLHGLRQRVTTYPERLVVLFKCSMLPLPMLTKRARALSVDCRWHDV